VIEQQDSQRRAVLQALLLLTMAAGILFFFLNMQRGAVTLATVELVMSAASAILLWVVRRTDRLRFWTLAYLIPFLCVMMLSMATPRVTSTICVWILLIPVLTHLLLGRWLGLLLSVLFMGTGMVLYLRRVLLEQQTIEPVSLANVVICGLAILALSHVFEWSRERSETALRRLATTDALTGLSNRGEFDKRFRRHCERALRDGRSLALLLIDLDEFKQINDMHGHACGDTVLQAVARTLNHCVRPTDSASRLGGEEFAVLLTDINHDDALAAAERIRLAIEQTSIRYRDHEIRVTASIGLAELGLDGHDLEAIYRAADARLYQSKAAGRNRVSAGTLLPREQPAPAVAPS